MSRAARSLVLLVVLVAGGGVAGALRPRLALERRERLGIGGDAPPPPDVAVAGVLLGSFRGLVVDYLWIRATRLEEEGKFFEALELARWIGKLQPRLEQVWSFQAHGLAYNLSAACDDAPSRWRWVQNGISLLRDDGLGINPRSPELYFMLSRIYSDKVGGPFDDHHLFLKKSLAFHFQAGFGPLGEEPDLEGLAAASAKLGPDEEALQAELVRAGLELPGGPGARWDEALARSEGARKAFETALADPARGPVARRLRDHVRAAWLRGERIDPAKVLEVERAYGPLEWRGCYAHALYWAVEGARVARGLGPARAAREERRLERLAISAVKNAMRSGRTIVLPDGQTLFSPEPRLAFRVIALYDEAIARARAAEERNEAWEAAQADDDDGHHHGPAEPDVTAAVYRNSLEQARRELYAETLLLLAQYGREAEARKVYRQLVGNHPADVTKPYEDFVGDLFRLDVLGEGVADQRSTYRALLGTWTRAWTALALGNDEHALGLIGLADRIHREWERFVQRALEQGDAKALERLGTVPLGRIKQEAFEEARRRVSPLLRARLEERAPALMGERPAPREGGR